MILRLNGGETHPIEAILDAKGPGKSLSHVVLGMQGKCIVQRESRLRNLQLQVWTGTMLC
jgi:hypothetical protein